MFSDSVWMNSLIWYFIIQLVILYVLLAVQFLIIKFANKNLALTIIGSSLILFALLWLFYVLLIASPFASAFITLGTWVGFALYGYLLYKTIQIIISHLNNRQQG